MTAPIDNHETAILVVAAGRGVRAGGGTPKQYRSIAGLPVLTHTLNRLTQALPGAAILTVIHGDDRSLYDEAAARVTGSASLLPPALGGATRQQSVLNGLKAISELNYDIKFVLIHDSVRIISSKILLKNALACAAEFGAAVPVVPVSDSLRRNTDDGFSQPADRTGLLAVQTPQAFGFPLILGAHEQAAAAGEAGFTDDASVVEWANILVKTFPGDPANFKLTTPEDFVTAEALLLSSLADIRVGYGYDVHAFDAGDHVWLGGIKIPHSRALSGHSDADVGLHALTDALLGAIADGDIGQHFPPSDPRWRGTASEIFLKEAVRRVGLRGGMIAHLDLTFVCEEPKIGAHRDAIRASIATIAGLNIDRVAVKATTSEKLGFTGRSEGIAANAVATVRLPLSTG